MWGGKTTHNDLSGKKFLGYDLLLYIQIYFQYQYPSRPFSCKIMFYPAESNNPRSFTFISICILVNKFVNNIFYPFVHYILLMYNKNNQFRCSALAKIALFCKFRFEGQPERFANVCNVRWLPYLSRRAEAGGQKLSFSCSIFQSVLLLFCLSVFQLLESSFNVRIGLSLGGNGGNKKRRAFRSSYLSSYQTVY